MLYKHQEHGVDMGSELFLVTPSKLAESLLFCLHRCEDLFVTRIIGLSEKILIII